MSEDNGKISEGTQPKDAGPKKKRIPVQDWVANWLFRNNAKLDLKTGMIFLGSEPNPVDLLLSKIVLDADRSCYDVGVGKLKHALDVWRPLQVEDAKARIANQTLYQSDLDDGPLLKFMLAVTGKENNPIDVAVMKHFVWQIKRKLQGLKVGSHIMPIFFGKTNAGKTEAIKHFLAPIYEIYKSPQDMTVIKDERSSRILFDCYCIFFDEMAKATTVDVSRLKNVISSEDVSYRPMATNTVTTLINNATFIGATNTTLIETIYDPTSMRRFWQIETMDVLDWASVNSVPYIDIWRSIDPSQDSPIKPLLAEINKRQHNEFRNMFPLEEYLTNHCEPLAEENIKDWYSDKELYDNFKTWMKWQNLEKFTPTLARFTNGFKYFKTREEGVCTFFDLGGKIYVKKRIEAGIRYGIKPNSVDFSY